MISKYGLKKTNNNYDSDKLIHDKRNHHHKEKMKKERKAQSRK